MRFLAFMLAVGLSVSGLRAQERPEIHVRNNHKFLSAPTELGRLNQIAYEVCNNGQSASQLHWKAAGFGVWGRFELPKDLCAIRTISGGEAYGIRAANVDFQGGASPEVPTWVFCTPEPSKPNLCPTKLTNVVGNAVADLRLLASRPYGIVAMEQISLTLIRDAKTGMGRLLIRSSDGVEQVFLVFPDAAGVGLKELEDLFKGNTEIQIQTFSYFKDVKKLTAALLATDIKDSSPVIAISKPKEGGYEKFLTFGDITKIGQLIVLLAQQGDQIAARNDLEVPQRFREPPRTN
jgi:hypothetical protein